MSARRGWNIISKDYQSSVKISLDDVHYGPISPGERELKLLGNVNACMHSETAFPIRITKSLLDEE